MENVRYKNIGSFTATASMTSSDALIVSRDYAM